MIILKITQGEHAGKQGHFVNHDNKWVGNTCTHTYQIALHENGHATGGMVYAHPEWTTVVENY